MSEREIQWFMRELVLAWSSLEPGAIAALHDEPFLLSSPGAARSYASRDKLEAALTQRIAFYRKQGVAQVELVKMNIEAPRYLRVPVFGTVQAEWRLWTTNGLPLLTFHTSQILRKTPAGWRVSATANHDEAAGFKARLG